LPSRRSFVRAGVWYFRLAESPFSFKDNIRDIRPIMSDRIHRVLCSMMTFEGTEFGVLNFVPQLAVTALKAAELAS